MGAKINSLIDQLNRFASAIVGPEIRLWPLWLLTMVTICFVLFCRGPAFGSFLRWLFPARIYLHKSHFVDIKLFFVGRFLSLIGAFNAIATTVFVTATVMSLVGGEHAPDATLHPLLIALLLLLANDFTVYWVHRVHHEAKSLWPFHAVHHSAEVLTPVTAYRKHPIYDVLSALARGVVLGLVNGILLGTFVGKIQIASIAGINVFYAMFNFVGSNIRHTHIWLSYGRVLEHLFISPAQHQIHHSLDPQHYNKNYGEVLAIWDWMFGTLYVPNKRETLEFGIADETGARVAQPHDTLTNALVTPMVDSWKSLRQLAVKTTAPGEYSEL